MKVGIVGTGNMGTILSEALLAGNVISPSDFVITNRTKSKAIQLKDKYPGMFVAEEIKDVIKQADVIFLCVKPNQFHQILSENGKFFDRLQCVVSITSPIKVSWLERMVPASCARIIPSITNRALAGITLCTFGSNCSEEWKNILLQMFSNISIPLEIDEDITRVSSDIVSCGPAFYGYMTRRFINAAVAETDIDENTATKLFEHMLIGLGELLKQGHYSLPELIDKVSVRGGITGEGIDVLERELGDVFNHVFQATHNKFYNEKDELERIYIP